MSKHENDCTRYESKVRDAIKHVILGSKGFVSEYVTKIENCERGMMFKYDLVVLTRMDNAPNPFPHLLDSGETFGTHDGIGCRVNKSEPIDVFIPDNKDAHVTSNFYVHTCMLMRDRFIQRALMDVEDSDKK